jgi:hypothetical protein
MMSRGASIVFDKDNGKKRRPRWKKIHPLS